MVLMQKTKIVVSLDSKFGVNEGREKKKERKK